MIKIWKEEIVPLREYLEKEFRYNNLKKYLKYFDEWFDNLTEEQKFYYKAWMNGLMGPWVE